MSILGATAIAGLGLSALSGVLGMSQASKARRQQQALINRQAASNEAWYQRNYYQNYLDSSEARSAMKRVEDTLRRRNQQAEGQAAVTGATREAVLAQQENDQTALADTAERLAARGDEVKRQVDAQNQANKAGITNMEMQQAQAAESGGQQLLSNGIALLGNSLSTFAAAGSSKGASTQAIAGGEGTAPAATSSPTATPSADAKVADTNNAAQAGAVEDVSTGNSLEDLRKRNQLV